MIIDQDNAIAVGGDPAVRRPIALQAKKIPGTASDAQSVRKFFRLRANRAIWSVQNNRAYAMILPETLDEEPKIRIRLPLA